LHDWTVYGDSEIALEQRSLLTDMHMNKGDILFRNQRHGKKHGPSVTTHNYCLRRKPFRSQSFAIIHASFRHLFVYQVRDVRTFRQFETVLLFCLHCHLPDRPNKDRERSYLRLSCSWWTGSNATKYHYLHPPKNNGATLKNQWPLG
jgi:hypothetical protein